MSISRRTESIKAGISIRAFYRSELPDMPDTRRAGWVNGGLCPFHDDGHAGSFRVNLMTGAFKCFSCQSKGGDIVAFTMGRHRLSFRDALDKLIREWGV